MTSSVLPVIQDHSPWAPGTDIGGFVPLQLNSDLKLRSRPFSLLPTGSAGRPSVSESGGAQKEEPKNEEARIPALDESGG